jgi:hypothetical protein
MHVRVTEKNPSARASSDRGGCWQHVGDEKTLRSRFEGRRGMVADEGHAAPLTFRATEGNGGRRRACG